MNTEVDSFAWDDAISEIDFFGEVVTNPNKDKKEEEPEKQKEDSTSKEPDKKQEVENVDWFEEGDTKEVTEEDTSSKDSKDFDKKENLNLNTINYLKSKGIIDIEDSNLEDLEDDDALTLLEDSISEKAEKLFEQSLEGLSDTVKNIVKYEAQGGDIEEYLSKLSGKRQEGITKDLDLEKEENQEKIVRYQLKKEGYDEEYIESQIGFLKDSNKLKSISEKHFNKWNKENRELEEEILNEQKLRKEKSKQDQISFRKEISQYLSNNESINELKFSSKDAKELPDYIGINSVKLQDGREISQFQKDLFESMKDKNSLLILAKMVKNNFSFKDIEKQLATKEANKVKDELERQKDKKIKSVGSSPKRLTDYL